MNNETGVLPCPWCDKIPTVTVRCYGHQMGRLQENRFGKKYDPLSGANDSTDFRCSTDCLGNITLGSTWLWTRGCPLNRDEVVKAEAIYKWNDRSLPADLILKGAESWVDAKRAADEKQKLQDAIEFEKSG